MISAKKALCLSFHPLHANHEKPMNHQAGTSPITTTLLSIVFFAALPTAINASDSADAIRKYQKSLIEDEITGSNVVMIYRDGKPVYHGVVQSGKEVLRRI